MRWRCFLSIVVGVSRRDTVYLENSLPGKSSGQITVARLAGRRNCTRCEGAGMDSFAGMDDNRDTTVHQVGHYNIRA